MNGDVSGLAFFKASRILCLASSRNERFEIFLTLPGPSLAEANDRLNMMRVRRPGGSSLSPTSDGLVVGC